MSPTERIERGVRVARRTMTFGAVGILAACLIADATGSVALAGELARHVPPPAVAPRARTVAAEGSAPGVPVASRLDLNSATGAELEGLPGIGPAKARRIVAFRARHGAFRRVVDLRRVKGFGKKTVDRLAPHLVVRPVGVAR